MKVLLTSDVPRVGHKGQILDVSDAYGTNVIINKKLGVRATEQIVNAQKQKEKIKQEAKEKANDVFISLFESIAKKGLTIHKKGDEKGHLYAKVSARDIIDAVYEDTKVSISDKQVEMGNIEQVGEYEVVLVHNQKKYKVKLSVLAQ